MGGDARSEYIHISGGSSREAPAGAAGGGTEQLLGVLPCFPVGGRDRRSLTGTFLSFVGVGVGVEGCSVWFSLGFKSSLCAFEMDVCLT